MAMPTDVTWGNTITNGSEQGRIGITREWEDRGTSEYVKVSVWFVSKYAVYDTNNKFSYARDVDPVLVGSKTINHTSNSAWNEKNQTLLATYEYNLPKQQTEYTTYFKASLSGIDTLGSSKVTSASRSYTVFKLDSYTVSYDANGGMNAPSNQTKWYGSNLTLSSSVPTRTGYSFLGWSTTSNGGVVYNANDVYSANANLTLYAVWKPYSYAVVYDANGGTNAPNNQTKTHDITMTITNSVPTRQFYNFLGWATNSSATTPTYYRGSAFDINANTTLYAVWELAYVKPRINNFVVYRCDENGTPTDEGVYVKMSFNYATDENGTRYRAYYKRNVDSYYIECVDVDLAETSGYVETFLKTASGNVVFDIDYAYDIQLNVADNYGYNTKLGIVNAQFIIMDITEDGRNVSFGESAHDDEDGVLRFAFDTVDIAPKESFKYKGKNFFGGELLWQGNSLFTEASQITIPSVAKYKNGLVLVFSRNGDYNFMSFFVPKELVAKVSNASVTFMFCTSLFDYIGQKTLYITDTTVTGHADNDATGKNATSGITYHNEAFFLRYVYAV